jgi:hypothetical protein
MIQPKLCNRPSSAELIIAETFHSELDSGEQYRELGPAGSRSAPLDPQRFAFHCYGEQRRVAAGAELEVLGELYRGDRLLVSTELNGRPWYAWVYSMSVRRRDVPPADGGVYKEGPFKSWADAATELGRRRIGGDR